MVVARLLGLLSVAFAVGSCGLPPLMLDQDSSRSVAPSGPSVAAVLANIKCELWQAANDENELPYYLDAQGLPPHPPSRHPSPGREFTLKNLFEEIEYVAELKLTLETLDSGAVNPSVNFIQPLAVAATNLTTAVGAQAFGSTDRIFDLYQSIDFQRLVASIEHPRFRRGFKADGISFSFLEEPHPGAMKPFSFDNLPNDQIPCDQGLALHGKLGLREDLATSAIASAMQDSAVLLKTVGSSGTVWGQTPALAGFNGYAFGEMDTTINFTINLDLNVGPNWTLATFKGPNVTSQGGTNGSGLVNVSRYVKDSLTLTVIPVCIRQKYFPQLWLPGKLKLKPASGGSPSMTGDLTGQVKKDGSLGADFKITPSAAKATELPIEFPMYYDPEMVFGTPVWANYLPPCLSAAGKAALAAAPATAKSNLQIQGIDNLLRSQRRF
jgi:hypothetical protein